jgi:hypothetical protein
MWEEVLGMIASLAHSFGAHHAYRDQRSALTRPGLDDRCSSLLRAAEHAARFEDVRGSLWRLPSAFAE